MNINNGGQESSLQEEQGLHDVFTFRRSTCGIISYISDPYKWPYRYMILFLICFIRFTCNYLYDIPGSLEGVIIEVMNLDTTRYNLIYSVYSWSVVVAACVSGFIVDRFLGLRLGLLIFIVATNVGQGIIVLGFTTNTYWLLLLGRLFMGLGGEVTLFVCDALTSLWFGGGHELSFVFAIIAMSNRLGGASSLYANEPLYNSLGSVGDNTHRLGYVFLIDTSLSLLGIAFGAVIFLMDKRAERYIIERQLTNKKKRSFSLKDLKSFHVNYWLIIFTCAFYYSAYYPLVTIGQLFYSNKFGLSTNEANIANMLIYLVTIIGPLIGLVIGFVGFPLLWGLAGNTLAITMHGILALSGGYSYFPFLLSPFLAIAYVLFHTTVYPSVSLVVDHDKLATAFGLMISVLNLGYSIVDIIIAYIIDNRGYFLMETFFIAFQGLGICLLVILIVRVALSGKSKLLMSGCEARHLEKAAKEM